MEADSPTRLLCIIARVARVYRDEFALCSLQLKRRFASIDLCGSRVRGATTRLNRTSGGTQLTGRELLPTLRHHSDRCVWSVVACLLRRGDGQQSRHQTACRVHASPPQAHGQ